MWTIRGIVIRREIETAVCFRRAEPSRDETRRDLRCEPTFVAKRERGAVRRGRLQMSVSLVLRRRVWSWKTYTSSTLLNDDQRTVDDETVALDHPTDRTDDPDDVGDDDDDARREGRADVVAVVGIVDEIHDGAVEHLVIGDDGDDTDDARWNGCDRWEVWVTRDGDGKQEGGDGHRKAVADVDPKTPRRVLDVRRIEARVLRKDYGPVLERKRLRYCDIIEQTQRRKHLTIAIGTSKQSVSFLPSFFGRVSPAASSRRS